MSMTRVFIGEQRFRSLVARAAAENWAGLALGDRTVTVATALLGTPYVNYTLEIDDRVETPCANFHGLDCWTYYEISLAFARMLRSAEKPHTPEQLLSFIELERYRGGKCTGSYLSRMHHLEEVFYDNEKRGLGRNITRELGGLPVRRQIREMQVAWRSYRYLRNSPALRRGIAEVENRVSNLPVHYIPRAQVASIEPRLQNGDVVAIICADQSGYSSHVGLIKREGDRARFMHATSKLAKGRCTHLDGPIASYLFESGDHMGIAVFRPAEVS
jgi:hypothetical protein